MKRMYSVSYQITYVADVEAESPAEAAAEAAAYCPYDISGPAVVRRTKDNNIGVIVEWSEEDGELPTTDDGDE